MNFESFGQVGKPALVAVPGLFGGPENFRAMLDAWTERFYILVVDPNSERRKSEGLNLSVETMREVSFDSTAEDIARLLDQQGLSGAYLTGISLGGKVVYDFAAKFPERFLGGVITDVSPASFQNSELYRFVDDIVRTLDLGLAWDPMKAELQRRIPERSLRSLIQSQLHYPTKGQPPAEWKVGMKNFRRMLERQGIDEQFARLEAVDARLANEQRWIHVLHAASYSGISAASLPHLRALRCVRFEEVPNSTHFLHITHKDLIERSVIALLHLS